VNRVRGTNYTQENSIVTTRKATTNAHPPSPRDKTEERGHTNTQNVSKRPRQPSPHTAHLIKEKDHILYDYGPLSRRALIHTNINLTLKFVQDKACNVEISTPHARAMHIVGF